LRLDETRDRDRIERFLRQNTPAQLYALADLDDVFFPDTRWFAAQDGGEIRALGVLLDKLELPIFHAVAEPHEPAARALLLGLASELPACFFGNLPLGSAAWLEPTHTVPLQGEYRKLWLPGGKLGEVPEPAGVVELGPADVEELRAFYAGPAYREDERGGRCFAPYMLELAPWFGLREGGSLVAVAGVHVCSRRYGVAALGNVATRPDRRGRGLARALTARLCRALLAEVPLVGLNVAADNAAAIHCYGSLGFREALRYEEAVFVRRC
jgi:GNAT superfamily N-acetyltransferase